MLQSVAAATVVGALSNEAAASYTLATEPPASEIPSRTARAATAPPWALIAPFEQHSEVGLGWSIADLEPIRRGAAVLVLAGPAGRNARVHLCRRGTTPRGVAWSATVDVLLMNGGAGDQPTTESLGRVLRLLGAGMSGTAPRGLMTHDERVIEYAGDHEALT